MALLELFLVYTRNLGQTMDRTALGTASSNFHWNEELNRFEVYEKSDTDTVIAHSANEWI